MVNESEDNIVRLKKKLYEREGQDFTHERSDLAPSYRNLNSTWQEETLSSEFRREANTGRSFLVNLLIFSFVVFLVALVGAGYIFLRGKNLVSNDNIEISIKGPAYVKAGDEVNLQLSIANKNNEPISTADLKITYPEGTKSASSSDQDLLRSETVIGEIASGRTINQSIRAVIFGQENTEKEIKFLLNYHIPGSSALFQKEQIYKFTINASPLNVTFTVPPESNSNQQVTLAVKAVSNSTSILKNVLLKVTYPPGFQYRNANLKPVSDNNIWLLGDIAPGKEKSLNITGILAGQDEDMKAFQVTAGVADVKDPQKIGVVYNDILKTVSIKRPFLGLTMSVDGENKDEYAAKSESLVLVRVNWANNLATELVNGEVTVKLDGETLDKFSVDLAKGFYHSENNTITLTRSGDSDLANIAPGAKGFMQFNLRTLPQIKPQDGSFVNQAVTITAEMKGTRTSEGFAGEEVSTVVTKKIKLESNVRLAATASYNSGPFTNTGPLPPKIDTETTYTIKWSVVNPANDVKNAVVQAVLPSNVRWLNEFDPLKENVTYDTNSRMVTWTPGHIKAQTGVTVPAREMSFKVAITPSASQVGGVANLLSRSTLSTTDTFTNTALDSNSDILDTGLSGTDALGTPNKGVVVR